MKNIVFKYVGFLLLILGMNITFWIYGIVRSDSFLDLGLLILLILIGIIFMIVNVNLFLTNMKKEVIVYLYQNKKDYLDVIVNSIIQNNQNGFIAGFLKEYADKDVPLTATYFKSLLDLIVERYLSTDFYKMLAKTLILNVSIATIILGYIL